eukprot:SAG11_NODE_142_length_14906_cov_8.352333_8_plen_127_part_00
MQFGSDFDLLSVATATGQHGLSSRRCITRAQLSFIHRRAAAAEVAAAQAAAAPPPPPGCLRFRGFMCALGALALELSGIVAVDDEALHGSEPPKHVATELAQHTAVVALLKRLGSSGGLAKLVARS